MDTFKQLQAQSEKHGLPAFYKGDLAIDGNILATSPDPSRKFLWLLRESGTQFLWLDTEAYPAGISWGPRPCTKCTQTWAELWGDDSGRDMAAHWYYFDGRKLREVTQTEALRIAATADVGKLVVPQSEPLWA